MFSYSNSNCFHILKSREFFSNYIQVQTDNPELIAANDSYVAISSKRNEGITLYELDQYIFSNGTEGKVDYKLHSLLQIDDASKIRDLAFSPFGNLLVSTHNEQGLKIWDCASKTQLIWNKENPALNAIWHSYVENLLLLNYGINGTVGLFDVSTQKHLSNLKLTNDLKGVSKINWFKDASAVWADSTSIHIADFRSKESNCNGIDISLRNNWRVDQIAPISLPNNLDPTHILFIGNSLGEQKFGIIDVRKNEILHQTSVNRGSSKQFYTFNEANSILFIGTRGYSQIKPFDIYKTLETGDQPQALDTYTGTKSFSSFAVIPERSYNVRSAEIVRIIKLLENQSLEQVSFHVPKRVKQYEGKDIFFEDIYIPTPSKTPSKITVDELLSGENGKSNTESLQPEGSISIYDIPTNQGGKSRDNKEGETAPVKSKYTLELEKKNTKAVVDPFEKYRHESQTSSITEGIMRAVAMVRDSDDEEENEESDFSDGDW